MVSTTVGPSVKPVLLVDYLSEVKSIVRVLSAVGYTVPGGPTPCGDTKVRGREAVILLVVESLSASLLDVHLLCVYPTDRLF